MILGLNDLVTLGAALIYCIYLCLCFAILTTSKQIAEIHPKIMEEWTKE